MRLWLKSHGYTGLAAAQTHPTTVTPVTHFTAFPLISAETPSVPNFRYAGFVADRSRYCLKPGWAILTTPPTLAPCISRSPGSHIHEPLLSPYELIV